MVAVVTNLLVISVTVNWCLLCVNIVQRLHGYVAEGLLCTTVKPLRDLCRRYANTPWILARTITEQFIVWLLVILAVVAMCTTDVIRYPFRIPSAGTEYKLLDVIFAVNIGKYIFITSQTIFVKRTSGPVIFRINILHHVVTLVCYAVVLGYRQNAMLGLVGILMEITTLLDALGRHVKSSEKPGRTRELAVLRCAVTTAVRGVTPLTFLVISMLHQSPFIMHYGPLTIFFLSIVFFSVVNVWLILTSVRRSIRHWNTNEAHIPTYTDGSTVPPLRLSPTDDHGCSVTVPHHDTGRQYGRQLPYPRNNLGWLRPCDNRNLTDNQEQCDKTNLNNRKEYVKESMELNIRTLTRASMGTRASLDTLTRASLGTVAYSVYNNCHASAAGGPGGSGADGDPLDTATRTGLSRVSADSTDSATSDRPLVEHNIHISLLPVNTSEQPAIHRDRRDRYTDIHIPTHSDRRLFRSQSMDALHNSITDCNTVMAAGASTHS